MTYDAIEKAKSHMEKALAEPPLTLSVSGGGLGTETGDATHSIIQDGAILLPRMLVEELVGWLKGVQLTPAK